MDFIIENINLISTMLTMLGIIVNIIIYYASKK